jgi:hypothetical protein
LFLLAGLGHASAVLAVTCTTVTTGGNWNVAANWNCTAGGAHVPLAGEDVIVDRNFTVNAATASLASMTLNAGTLTQSSALTIQAGGALNIAGGILNSNNTVSVGGPTNVTAGTFNLTTASARTFTGLVTINGGTWAGTTRAATFQGGITFTSGTFTPGTGVQTFNTNSQSIGGASAISIPSVTVTGVTLTNNVAHANGLTVTTALAGTGGLTNNTLLNLNFTGAVGITTLTASAVGNTVSYGFAGNQTVKLTAGAGNPYGNLILGGTGTKTMPASFQINGTTTVSSTVGLGAAGTKLFVGAVTINPGGIWNNGVNRPITFRGGITHNGTTFTGGTGINTFNTNSQALAGASAMTFGGAVTVTGAITLTNNNSNTVTITGTLNGTAAGSTFVNGTNATLNYGAAAAPMATGVLTASASPNTVNYNRANTQTIRATTYHHLTLSGTSAKTAAAGLTVNGNFTQSGSAGFTAGAFTHNFYGNWVINTTAAPPLTVATTSLINFNTPAVPAPTSMGGTTTATVAFADVNINNTSGVTFNDNASFSAGTTPTLTVAANATLTPAAAVIISGTGTLTGSGTVQVTRTAATADFSSQYTIATKTLTNLTVEYIGAAAQTISVLTYGSATGGGLKVNNTSGVSLTANTTVAGTLILTSGIVAAGAFTLISSGDCTTKVTRTGGHVAGLLQLAFPTGTPSCTFHVGDATTYRPINASFASVTVAGSMAGLVSQAAGEHPNIATSGLDSAKDVNRYWTLTNPAGGTIAFTTYTGTFNFINPGDFDVGATPASFEIERWDGAAWNTTTLGTAGASSTSASALPSFAAGSSNSFALGEKTPSVVVSINRAAADPTNATSVSWTVIFSRSVTGVAGGNFTLVPTGLGGTPAITSVSGSGTTWTVTASTGSGSGTLGLNMTSTTGVTPAITGLPFAGQVYTIDRTAPAVSSIVRANPNPTSQASVSWTVTFTESVTGVDMSDYSLVQTGGVSGATIASVIGSGTSWTVTANTGSGQGKLGLNLVDDDSIVDAVGNPLGGAGTGNGNFSGELYDIVSSSLVFASPTACTNVAGIGTVAWAPATLAGPLGSDDVYATASVDGTTTNFLQCIGYGFAIPAGATINGITVNVERKSSSIANGGSRDAAMRLVKDVAGVASIQATDRSTATTYTATDVVEAHGGATDLWGATWTAADINAANFGAAFAATKASGAGAAHTVSVDHMQIGISYAALPHHYELSLPTSGITCLPVTVTVKACADSSSPCTNLYANASGTSATLATTAGALGSTTVVFNVAGVASTTLSYPAASDGATASVTLSTEQIAATNPRMCCPDGVSCAAGNSCSAIFNTAGFILSGAVNGAAATIPTQVAGTSAGTYYLRAVKTSTTTKACETALAGASSVSFAYECNNPATCSATDLMSVNGGTATTIARNNDGSVTSYTPVSMLFDANGNAPFSFNFSDVGQVKLHVSKAAGGALLSALAGSSNAFVVKPYGFTVSVTGNPAAADATGAAFVKAGASFSATVTATANGGAATPNYGKESTAEGVKLTAALVPGLGLTNLPTLSNATIPGSEFGSGGMVVDANGIATVTNLAWNEVGIIRLTPSVADASYLGAGDVTGTVSANVGRFYPDHFTLSAGSITTRTDISPACSPASTFSYMNEPFQAGFTLTASGPSPGNATLLNYVSSATSANRFAKLATGSPIPAGFGFAYLNTATNLTTRVDSSLGITGDWAAGALAAVATLGFTRAAAPDGPYSAMKVGIAPADSDGVVLSVLNMDVTAPAGDDHAEVGETQIRFGRLRLLNAYGSELLPLRVPVRAEYFNVTNWTVNAADSCTSLLANAFFLSGGIAANTSASAVALSAGIGTLTLAKPSPVAAGSVDVAANLGASGSDQSCLGIHGGTFANMPWLRGFWAPAANCNSTAAWAQDPNARVKFGSPKAPYIYLRERY